ncbi:phage tail protein [Achromobacter insolitus]|uniref:phage tail protein n=1 Tax=Achromobacter insolitus TaxID=217204 RepID=UPI001EEE862A|nr:phage tail protein [Achromobacter insolitus]
MAGWIDVVHCPNPLRPVADRRVRRVLLTGTDTVESIVKRLGLQATPLAASLNMVTVPRKRWHKKRVRTTDTLILMQCAAGVETGLLGAKILMNAAWYEIAATALLTFLTSDLVIGLALTMVANAIMSNKGGKSGSQESSPATYSIDGGSNSIRPYEPLPLVLGEHQVFPDYGSRPYTEFVPDETTTRIVVNGTASYKVYDVPPFTFPEWPESAVPGEPWTLIVEDEYTAWYGDNAPRTYRRDDDMTIEAPHTFVVRVSPPNGQSATIRINDWESYQRDLDDGSRWPDTRKWESLTPTREAIEFYGYWYTDHTERLVSIFNFGFGDLTITNPRVGSNDLGLLKAWQRSDSYVVPGQGDRTYLSGFTSPDWPTNEFPTNVESVDGGKLEQRANIENGGWIVREGAQACGYVQIDIAGRLFRQSTSGIKNLSCTLEMQYQVEGQTGWTDFPFSPYTLTNGFMAVLRKTFTANLGVPIKRVQVRRVTPEETDANRVSDLECSRVKWFRSETALYPAQRRLGLLINATGQLSGRLERFSAFVQAKHWIWSSTAPWTEGVYPGDGQAPWFWGPTTNPAWLFLYYARGGFLNAAAAPGYLGWQGWIDRPDASNGARLFGAGLTNDRIDYAALVAWGRFCDLHGLQCRMVIDARRSAGEVLDDIAAAGRASKTWATGKLSVVWEEAGQPAVAGFGMPNILAGTFNIAYDTDDTIDEFGLQYTRSDADYAADTVYATVPGVSLPVNQRMENAAFAMPRSLAQRLVNLLAASKFFHRRRISWESNIEALAVQRGDVVRLTHDLTAWAYSGRLLGLRAETKVVAESLEAKFIVELTLSCPVENPGGSPEFYLWVRRPSGVWVSVQVVPPATRTNTVEVLTPWGLADAPGILSGSLDDLNEVSDYPDSIPEDWMFLAGPTPTPGKRVRIVAMEPANQRRVKITARDEYEEFFPMEWGTSGAPLPPSGEARVARAYNLAALPQEDGGTRLAWELDAAHGALVTVRVNQGPEQQVPITGQMAVVGYELFLPAYPAGTRLDIHVLPVAAGTPVAIQGDELTITV